MKGMFRQAKTLTSLYLGNFITTNVGSIKHLQVYI